jgi:hypothetical protein
MSTHSHKRSFALKKSRMAALEQVFDVKWSSEHAGALQTEDGRGILHHAVKGWSKIDNATMR